MEQQQEFITHMSAEEKDILARRRALVDELDLFDNYGTAARATDRLDLLL